MTRENVSRYAHEKGVNLNTMLIVFSILGAVFTTVKLGGPILSSPERLDRIAIDVNATSRELQQIQHVQSVQSEALKTLASIADSSVSTRRDTDRHSTEIAEIRRRLDRLESRP